VSTVTALSLMFSKGRIPLSAGLTLWQMWQMPQASGGPPEVENIFQPVSSQRQKKCDRHITSFVKIRFFVISDTLITELSRHILAYSNVAKKFSVLRECLSNDRNNFVLLLSACGSL